MNGRPIWLGRALTLGGQVRESLYGLGLQLTLGPAAVVGRDLGMLGANLLGQPGSQVQGSVAMGGNVAVIGGTVQQSLRFTGRSLEVRGAVGGPTAARVPPSGLLGAGYAAPTGEDPAGYAALPGTAHLGQQEEATGERVLAWFLVFLRALVTLLVVGALALWLFGARFTLAAEQVRLRPLTAAAWGFLVWLGGWVAVVLGAIVVLVTWVVLLVATLGSLAWWVLAVGGSALALASAIFLLLVALVSKVVAAYLVGSLILDRLSGRAGERRGWSLVIGVIIFLLLRAIPYFGWLVGVVATLLGLGGIWLTYYRRRRRAERALPPQTL